MAGGSTPIRQMTLGATLDTSQFQAGVSGMSSTLQGSLPTFSQFAQTVSASTEQISKFYQNINSVNTGINQLKANSTVKFNVQETGLSKMDAQVRRLMDSMKLMQDMQGRGSQWQPILKMEQDFERRNAREKDPWKRGLGRLEFTQKMAPAIAEAGKMDQQTAARDRILAQQKQEEANNNSILAIYQNMQTKLDALTKSDEERLAIQLERLGASKQEIADAVQAHTLIKQKEDEKKVLADKQAQYKSLTDQVTRFTKELDTSTKINLGTGPKSSTAIKAAGLTDAAKAAGIDQKLIDQMNASAVAFDKSQKGVKNWGYAMLFAGNSLQDFASAGLMGITNNVSQLTMALGGAPAMAGQLTIAMVALQYTFPLIKSSIADMAEKSFPELYDSVNAATKAFGDFWDSTNRGSLKWLKKELKEAEDEYDRLVNKFHVNRFDKLMEAEHNAIRGANLANRQEAGEKGFMDVAKAPFGLDETRREEMNQRRARVLEQKIGRDEIVDLRNQLLDKAYGADKQKADYDRELAAARKRIIATEPNLQQGFGPPVPKTAAQINQEAAAQARQFVEDRKRAEKLQADTTAHEFRQGKDEAAGDVGMLGGKFGKMATDLWTNQGILEGERQEELRKNADVNLQKETLRSEELKKQDDIAASFNQRGGLSIKQAERLKALTYEAWRLKEREGIKGTPEMDRERGKLVADMMFHMEKQVGDELHKQNITLGLQLGIQQQLNQVVGGGSELDRQRLEIAQKFNQEMKDVGNNQRGQEEAQIARLQRTAALQEQLLNGKERAAHSSELDLKVARDMRIMGLAGTPLAEQRIKIHQRAEEAMKEAKRQEVKPELLNQMAPQDQMDILDREAAIRAKIREDEKNQIETVSERHKKAIQDEIALQKLQLQFPGLTGKMWEIQHRLRTNDITEEQAQQMRGLEKQRQLTERRGEAIQKIRAYGEQAYEETKTPNEKLYDEMLKLGAAHQLGDISSQTYNRKVGKMAFESSQQGTEVSADQIGSVEAYSTYAKQANQDQNLMNDLVRIQQAALDAQLELNRKLPDLMQQRMSMIASGTMQPNAQHSLFPGDM